MTFQGENGKQYVAIVAGVAGGARGGGGGGLPQVQNQGLVVFAPP